MVKQKNLTNDNTDDPLMFSNKFAEVTLTSSYVIGNQVSKRL